MTRATLLVLIYGLVVAHTAVYQIHMRRHRSWRERPKYEISATTRNFKVALLPVYVVLLGSFPFVLYGEGAPFPDTTRIAAGVGLGVAAIALLAWSLASLGENFSDCSDGRLPTEYVKRGPYRFFGHPIYGSNILLLIALGTIVFSWTLVVVGVLLVALYARSAREESRALKKLFAPSAS